MFRESIIHHLRILHQFLGACCLLLILIIGSGCGDLSRSPLLDEPTNSPQNDEGDVIPPTKEVFNYSEASAYSASFNGLGVLAMQEGEIVFEEYHGDSNLQTSSHLHSATKGFWGVVVARMIQEGLLEGFDQKASDILEEWQGTAKGNITIRQIMQLSSGLSNDIDNLQGTDPAAPDLYYHAVNNVNLVRAPGTRFSYGPVNFYVMGAIMARVLQQAGGQYTGPLDYLNKKFFIPIGIEYSDWVHDDVGNPHIPNGAFITPRNWIKWGQFLLQKGKWQGQQLVDSRLFEELLEPASTNPGHGLFIWLNTNGGFGIFPFDSAPKDAPGGMIYHDGLNDIYSCMGAGKNRMYMVPSKNLIILRQTEEDNDDFSDTQFLGILFE